MSSLVPEGRRLLAEISPEGLWEVVSTSYGFMPARYNGEGACPVSDLADANLIVWMRNNLAHLLDQIEVNEWETR